MIDFSGKISTINSKDDFIAFLKLLCNDLKSNPGDWQNISLPEYLEAIANWTEDMAGFYQNSNFKVPRNIQWKVFANILMAAKSYE